MTQAFNLSQLANNLNSSGQLDATDGLVNAVPVANGGTGASTPSAAQVNLDVPATDGTGATGEWPIDISGNAATASEAASFTTTNWVIEQSGTSLVFKYNGVAVGSISSSGVINAASNLTTTSGNITASGVITGNSLASTTIITAGANIIATGTVTANGT